MVRRELLPEMFLKKVSLETGRRRLDGRTVHLRSGLASGAPVFGTEVLGYVGARGVMLQATLLQPHHVAGGACLCSDECLNSWCISAGVFLQKQSSASE